MEFFLELKLFGFCRNGRRATTPSRPVPCEAHRVVELGSVQLETPPQWKCHTLEQTYLKINPQYPKC